MKLNKRILSSVLASGMMVSMLAGCGGTTTGTDTTGSGDTASAEEPLQISVILNTLASEYWGYVQAGAEAYDAEHDDVEVTVSGPTAETMFDEQQNMVETALTSGACDGLVISALQVDTVNNMIKGTDLPIVSVNTDLGSEESLAFVGTGNEAAAMEGAKAAVEAAQAAGWETVTAINIAGVQGDPTHEQRTNGFRKGTEEAGGVFLADEIQYADSAADKAVTSMEAIMQNHPEGIAIIFCNNDDMAIAAARAAEGNKAYENTIFCGFDGIQSACESIIEGVETMSVAQDPYMMGYQSVEACVAAINGEELDEFIDTGCSVITSENAQEHLDLLKSYLGGGRRTGPAMTSAGFFFQGYSLFLQKCGRLTEAATFSNHR